MILKWKKHTVLEFIIILRGGLKISVGAGLAALSTYALATNTLSGKKLNDEQKKAKNIGGGVGLGIAAACLASGGNQILDERRISKLEKKIK